MLPQTPAVPPARRRKLDAVLVQTRDNPPGNLPDIVRHDLGVDLTTRYGGAEIAHPFGKASGQLSCTVPQVEEDVRAGLAFVVLKTVIAETASGQRSMAAWTVRDTKMRVERRTSAAGREGWTVTWTGRGWHGTLPDYLEFFGQALTTAVGTHVPIVPSVKYHLPAGDEEFQLDEYEFTTTALLDVWRGAGAGAEMLLEKDFSPTLAGDARARDESTILRWLERVPALVASSGGGEVRLGMKVMNAMGDDALQIAMLEALARAQPPPAYLIVFNRLFDEVKGVAFGGWDLSDRNLRVLDLARKRNLRLPPLSATGNICSGRMMVEYALRGCENGQIHTFFQLPRSEYTARGGSRSAAALHTLLLHPSEGLVAWLYHLHEQGAIEPVDGCLRFRDAIGLERG
jgi:hypothetical protein